MQSAHCGCLSIIIYALWCWLLRTTWYKDTIVCFTWSCPTCILKDLPNETFNLISLVGGKTIKLECNSLSLSLINLFSFLCIPSKSYADKCLRPPCTIVSSFMPALQGKLIVVDNFFYTSEVCLHLFSLFSFFFFNMITVKISLCSHLTIQYSKFFSLLWIWT